jgi:hypothetical protein
VGGTTTADARNQHRLRRRRKIIDIRIPADRPGIRQRIVDEPLAHGRPQTRRLEVAGELLRRDEAVPLMRAHRQPAQHILGADDGEQVGLQRAVDGREQHQASRPHQLCRSLQERRGVRHVLHHLEADHRVERQTFRGQLLDAPGAIVDVEALAGGVAARRLDRLGRRVEARHPGAQARQRLRNQSAAAAHVQNAQTFERAHAGRCAREVADELVAQEGEPRRTDPMQRAELASWVPPLGGEACETVPFGGIEGGAEITRVALVHELLGARSTALSRSPPSPLRRLDRVAKSCARAQTEGLRIRCRAR